MKNFIYKVFITLVENKKTLGTSILCEDFYSLETAKKTAEEKLLNAECYFTVRKYEEGNCIIGGDTNDTGIEAYSSLTEEYEFSELQTVIVDALDRFMGGYYSEEIMEELFPDFNPESCETSTMLMLTLAEMGANAVKEGKITLERLLS